MPTDEQIAGLRADAARVRDALHRVATRVPPDGPALPGELTCKLLNHAVALRSTAPLFVAMACTAVLEKYQAAGHVQVTQALTQLRDLALPTLQTDRPDPQTDPARLRHQLTLFTKRLGAHATRNELGDPDLHLCTALPKGGFAYSATAWVCQQPDLRYRWTPAGRVRLDFMAHCWDHYARSDYTAEDSLIGLLDFPLCASLRPDPHALDP